MGIFSKIKDNLKHGGVKLAIDAPDSVSMTDKITAKITLTAAEAATIKKMTLEVISESRGHSHIGNDNLSNDNYTVIAQTESSDALSLAAGETKTLEMSLQMPASAFKDIIPQNNVVGNLAQGLAGLASTAMNIGHYYYIQVNANVEGIALDPSVRKSLNISISNEAIQN